VQNTAPHSDEHFYEVSLKFLNACRRYAPDKIVDAACHWVETIIIETVEIDNIRYFYFKL
jgi:hypothetical protein